MQVVAATDVTQQATAWEVALGKHCMLFMAFTFLIYSAVSTTVFQTFACDKLTEVDEAYLRADYSISCQTSIHRAYMAYAAVMVVIYPVGMPLVYAWMLWQQRDVIVAGPDVSDEARLNDARIRTTRFLWLSYKSNRFWWELAECVRRLCLTGFLVFIMPGTVGQTAVACIFSVLSIVALSAFAPHSYWADASLYRLGCVIIFFSMFLALFIKANVTDQMLNENAQSQKIVSILLIVMNVGLTAACIAQCFFQGAIAVGTKASKTNKMPPPPPVGTAPVAADAAFLVDAAFEKMAQVNSEEEKMGPSH